MSHTNDHHDEGNKQPSHTSSHAKNNCQDSCKDMYHSKNFWIGAIIRILFMVALIISAYIFGLQQGMMKGMWMTSIGGSQYGMMKELRHKGDTKKTMPQQTKDGVPIMNITEGNGTTTGR